MEVIVVGGGAGGLTAARELVHLGARVTLVNAGPLGGECTWTGCVPSKTLIHSAAQRRPFPQAMADVRHAIARIAATEDADALQREGISVVEGRARLVAGDRVEVDGSRTLRADRIILATGSRPAVPAVAGLAAAEPLTNETVFALERQPAAMAVLGGGAIGCELAQAFARLGTTVTVVEALPRLLSREEPEASATIARALQQDGVQLRTGVAVRDVRRAPSGVVLELADGAQVEAEQVLVAAGRTPATDGLGLAEVGVAIDDGGHIVVDDTMATSVAGIFAAGDVTGRMLFTHAAGRMAYVAARNAMATRRLRRPQRCPMGSMPWATFTDPEVGRVGLTEAEAAAAHHRVRIAELPFDELDRAVVSDRTDGFVKLVVGPRKGLGHAGGGVLLGATVVAPNGGDLVHEAALAMHTRMFVGRLAQTTHAYPTWAMAVQLAALKLFDTGAGGGWRQARG